MTADRSRLAVLTGRAVEVWDLTTRRRIWRGFPEGRVTGIKFIGNDRIVIASNGNLEEFKLDEPFFAPLFVGVHLQWPCQPSVQLNQLLLPGPSDDLIMWDLTEGHSRYIPLELPQADGSRSKLGPPMVIRMAPDGATIATVHVDSEETIMGLGCHDRATCSIDRAAGPDSRTDLYALRQNARGGRGPIIGHGRRRNGRCAMEERGRREVYLDGCGFTRRVDVGHRGMGGPRVDVEPQWPRTRSAARFHA